MSLVPNRIIEGAAGNQGYKLQRSLRFRSSASANLTRTFATPTSATTWTFSGWVKRGSLGANTGGTSYAFFGSNTSGNNIFGFTGTDSLTIQTNGAASVYLITTQVFRDPSAWYHIVIQYDTTQATAANRCRLYVNGSQVTSFSTATYPTLNSTVGQINTAVGHAIGSYAPAGGWYFDGYLAEVNFIDGQALTPSSFGETDAVTGAWIPKKYSGTYGTNGFYLDFLNNTSATTLAYDKSGNNNNWTANNISTTAGANYDSMTDVPTLTSATAGNFCVMNPLNGGSNKITPTNGNITVGLATGSNAFYGSPANWSMTSGKWYWEVTAGAKDAAAGQWMWVGIINTSLNWPVGTWSGSYNGGFVYANDGLRGTGGGGTPSTGGAYGATWTTGDVIGVAFDADAGSLTFYKNGVSQGVAFSSISGLNNGYTPIVEFFRSTSTTQYMYPNFGQRPFSYTPPSGFKALNTYNLPDPTIKKPNQYMDATLYTGDGTDPRPITNSGSMQPDLVWIKARGSSTLSDHVLDDSVRGATNDLFSNLTAVEGANNSVRSFNAGGFSVGNSTRVNQNSIAYVGWQWKKGATPGFDIVTYTGTGANRTVSHSLGVAPKLMIIKSRTGGTYVNWAVYHDSLGNTQAVFLNLTNAAASSSVYWNNTSPTASVFSLGNGGVGGNNNESGQNYVAYLFAEIAGFSKFGSYTGNGSADGPFVFTNFRPRWIMAKRTDTAGTAWAMFDAVRDIDNPDEAVLAANSSGAETSTAGFGFDFNSNGFKVRATDPTLNASGGTYIYAAFAENPFKHANAR